MADPQNSYSDLGFQSQPTGGRAGAAQPQSQMGGRGGVTANPHADLGFEPASGSGQQGKPDEASVMGFLKNAASSTGHLVGDVTGSILHPQDTLQGITGLLEGMAEKVGAPPVAGVSHAPYVDAAIDLYKKRYGSWDGLKHTLYTDPAGAAADLATLANVGEGAARLAKFGAEAANLSKVADVAGIAAKGAKAVVETVDPLRGMATAAGKVVEKSPAAKLPEYLYRTALKGGYRVDRPIEEVRQMAQTGLDNAIPVSDTGARKIYSALDDLNRAVTDKVSNAARTSGSTISRQAVVDRLVPVEKKFAAQVAPADDMRDIKNIRGQFMATNLPDIPVDEAQAKKVGTYAQLQGKYGKLSSAEEEAQKALARGIKEELEAQMPELKNLNAGESKLLNLQGVIEKAVAKRFNQNGGMAPWLMGGTAGAVTKNVWAGAAVGVMKDIMADPNLRSRLAITLNRAGSTMPYVKGTARGMTIDSRIRNYQQSLEDYQNQQSGSR